MINNENLILYFLKGIEFYGHKLMIIHVQTSSFRLLSRILSIFCSTGKKATSYPDTCKIVTRGCDEVAVKKNNENETCDEEVSYVG